MEEGMRKSVSDSWLNNILQSLEKMQKYETYLMRGTGDIFEYVEKNNINVSYDEIQIENYKFFINESKILLSNSEKIMDEVSKKKIIILLDVEKQRERKYKGFVVTKKDFVQKKVTFRLIPEFRQSKENIATIRGLFVAGLWSILTPISSQTNNY